MSKHSLGDKKLSLGIIGLSPGNGHPYSWSAIFNGYNPEVMRSCDFPVIPEYLSRQTFPDDCIPNAKVTHIWTQNYDLSKHVAEASLIPNISPTPEDMIGHVDAILLARDDAETHFEFAKPFIDAGLPIYIDKPIATSIKEANQIYALEKYPGQVFTCSALAYANELQTCSVTDIRYIDACTIKDWRKYGIHVIEPTLKLINHQMAIVDHTTAICGDLRTVVISWENGLVTTFKSLANCKCGFRINVFGSDGHSDIVFSDTFNMFRSALNEFVEIVRGHRTNNSRSITMKAIEIIERGLMA